MEKVQSYEEAFAKIQAATGISDIDELVTAPAPRPRAPLAPVSRSSLAPRPARRPRAPPRPTPLDRGAQVTTFINAEDQNFALFNYVNELNGECEKLEEQIADIRSEIEKYKGQGLNTDNQRKKILKDLEERLARTEVSEGSGLGWGLRKG